ncbi:MAG TPA: dipeptidase [Steroidobacteraceae bacterium]|nr:dipeptidase [Steroidobacteraceae bacterium]
MTTLSVRVCYFAVLVHLSATSVAADKPITARQARAIHERIVTLDTHLDTPSSFARAGWSIMDKHDYATNLTQVDYPRMKAGGLDGGFWAVYTPQGPRTEAGERAARDAALVRALEIHSMVAANRETFALALNADDAVRIAAAGKRIVFLSIENGYPIGSDLSLLDTFYKLGVRLFGPVHFRNNGLGDSATDPSGPEWKGLSPLGKQLVVEANRLGIVLDASHASDDVFDQMIALSKTPIMLSHSGCKTVYNHARNLDDDRLRKLAAAGGVIQINSLSDYLIPSTPNADRDRELAAVNAKYGRIGALSQDKVRELAAARRKVNEKYPSRRATFDDFMNHVLHAIKVAGVDHVGIGADWDGGGGVTGMEDVGDLPKITERLLNAGYSEQDVAKVWSGNALRVLRAAGVKR